MGYGGDNALAIAKRLNNYLYDLGFSTFIAPDNVGVAEWEPTTRKALRRCDIFLIVYTEETIYSRASLERNCMGHWLETSYSPVCY